MDFEYPQEWNDLPKHERRKKIKLLKREAEKKAKNLNKIRKTGLYIVVAVIAILVIQQLTKKSPEEIAFKQEIESVSLEGKVEEYPIEGRDHVPAGTSVDYQTNPPTSGSHLAQAKEWGVFTSEIDDMAVVHSMEHGGIWISYKDISDEESKILEEIGKQNSQSTVVSPRSSNDSKVVVASWGKLMRLESADKALIQKYINTYKNQAPEKLAR